MKNPFEEEKREGENSEFSSEEEPVLNPEAKEDLVDYIRDHIESDLSSQSPEIRRKVAERLMILFEASEASGRSYALEVPAMLEDLKNEIISDQQNKAERKFFDFLETTKAALVFQDLDGVQRNKVKEMLLSMTRVE